MALRDCRPAIQPMKVRVCLKTDSGSLWEGYLPAMGPKPDEPAQRSHERGALQNTGPLEAVIDLTLYFADRDPVARTTLGCSLGECIPRVSMTGMRLQPCRLSLIRRACSFPLFRLLFATP